MHLVKIKIHDFEKIYAFSKTQEHLSYLIIYAFNNRWT